MKSRAVQTLPANTTWIYQAYCAHLEEAVLVRSKRGEVGNEYLLTFRPAQLAELSRSEFDPELFSLNAYDKFFVTFATKVKYKTFFDIMRQFLV